jgi:ABC-type sugar transport system substrate-binding protein
MKKIVVVLVLLVMVLGACAKATPEPTAVVPVVVEPTQRPGAYYFLAANNADPFYIPGVKGMEEAGKLVGMKTEFVGPMDLNVAAQLKTFEELVASPNTKGILWYPSDFAIGEEIIAAAHEKGIPVIIGALDSPYKGRDAFVGYDNTVLGTQAGAWAAKLIDCKGSVGTIGIQSGPNVPERIAGFENYIRSVCPEVTIVPQVTHDGSEANEAATLEAYMIANPDLTLLWWADGAAGIQAQLWKEKQELGVKTMFLATDMPPATLQAIKDNIYVGSIAQDTFTEEFISIIMLDLINKGYRIPDTMFLSAILIDKNNVDQYLGK